MKSVDTNIIARYVLQDDPVQSPLATRILTEACFITDTVLVEIAWLLSSRFRLRRSDLAATLFDLVSLPAVYVDHLPLVRWAIERFAKGADFADMMHIIGSRHVDGFVSFETRLDKFAGPDAPILIETLH